MLKSRTPEITIKFEELPELPTEGKRAVLRIQSECGIKLAADLNRKNAAKQIKKTGEFEAWIGIISGKVSGFEADGTILIEGAGLQIMEKKMKKEVPGVEPQKVAANG